MPPVHPSVGACDLQYLASCEVDPMLVAISTFNGKTVEVTARDFPCWVSGRDRWIRYSNKVILVYVRARLVGLCWFLFLFGL